MSGICVMCAEPTDSKVMGENGTTFGPMCVDCEFWCDGNVVSVAEATA